MDELLALIIEDEYDISIILAKALRAAGFETEIVRSGDTALAWLSYNKPDLVVLDLHLPKVSGKEILNCIRSDVRFSDVKVIVVTAYSDLAESLRGEADRTLIKPISFGQLRDLAANFGGPDKS